MLRSSASDTSLLSAKYALVLSMGSRRINDSRIKDSKVAMTIEPTQYLGHRAHVSVPDSFVTCLLLHILRYVGAASETAGCLLELFKSTFDRHTVVRQLTV